MSEEITYFGKRNLSSIIDITSCSVGPVYGISLSENPLAVLPDAFNTTRNCAVEPGFMTQ